MRRPKNHKSKVHPAAVKKSMPGSVEVMRPMLVNRLFSDPDWIYEIKWDGWRTLCSLRDGKAHLISRRKNSLSERFPELRDIGELIKAKTAIIDAEVVAIDEQGLPHFEALRYRRSSCSAVLYCFDLLYLLVTQSRNGKPRTIPLSTQARRIAEMQLGDETTGRYLFTSFRTGEMVTEIKTGFMVQPIICVLESASTSWTKRLLHVLRNTRKRAP